MTNPMEHFELHTLIQISLFGIDISINEAVVMMWIVVIVVFGLFWIVSQRVRPIPGRLQNLVEIVIEFLKDMIRQNMGEAGLVFLPFLSSLFLFILFCNLLGLVPGAYTATSQLIVTGSIAVLVSLVSLGVGFARHGMKIFVPPGAPLWLLPFLIPIEVISQLIRPFSLAIRLFANMTAGHTILAVMFGFVITLKLYIAWLPLGFTVFLSAFEIVIALFQAYIFTLLASTYIGEAIQQHE